MVETTEQRFGTADVLRMFPTFVWKAVLRPAVFRPINAAIVRALDQLGGPRTDLERGDTWQSDQNLHQRDDFRALVVAINDAAGQVLDHLMIAHEGFEITACWANIHAPGAMHQAHSHPNNFLSGVYYVNIFEGANTISFHDPRVQTGIIRPPVTELTTENTDQVNVTVTDGMLVLFPGWLQHSVEANRSDRMRISVSFNVMFSDFTKFMSKPLWSSGQGSHKHTQ